MTRCLTVLAFVSILLFSSLSSGQILSPGGSLLQLNTPLIVQLLPGVNINSILGVLGAKLIDSIPDANQYLLSLPVVPSTALASSLGIQWMETNTGVGMPNVAQLGVFNVVSSVKPDWYKTQPQWLAVNSSKATQYSTGYGVVVADLNSQVDYSHPALRGHLTGGYDFVNNRGTGTAILNQASSGFMDQSSSGFMDQASSGFMDQSSSGFMDRSGLPVASSNPAYSHGTECAGVIAALAPSSIIMPLRVFDDNGGTDLVDIGKAIRYAVKNGAQVINMSFGTLTNSKTIKSAIDYAQSKGVILVASAGNNNTSSPQYPAAYPGILTTAATDITDKKGSFSNYGSSVAVDGPGVNVILPYPGGLYTVTSGTSFSAPAVAATAALVRSLRMTGVAASITGTALNIDSQNPSYAKQLGYGEIDMLRAVLGK